MCTHTDIVSQRCTYNHDYNVYNHEYKRITMHVYKSPNASLNMHEPDVQYIVYSQDIRLMHQGSMLLSNQDPA